jgi:catalase-peroxidase
LGWISTYNSGKGGDTITSGLEGAWTPTPITWDNSYFDTLFGYEWELTKSPAGAQQWQPKNGAAADAVPDAHDPNKRHAPMMATTDLALIHDPAYLEISKRFHENPDEFADAFARAWFKLTHRDMGPVSRYLGPEVPKEELIWQDPVPAADYKSIDQNDVSELKVALLNCGLSVSELVSTAWAAAATYRGSDKRGGANGGRLRLEPQISWAVNRPDHLPGVLAKIEGVQKAFNEAQTDGKKSLYGGSYRAWWMCCDRKSGR